MNKLLYYLLMCFAVLALSAPCPPSQAADTIKVGIVDTYSGPATTYTQDVLDGFKLAIDKVNAAGGVIGKKIEYVTRDDKFKPDIALSMTKELVLREGIDLLMGSTNSGAALAMSDFAKKEKIPLL
jgi:branched-chain amino acid transport system substrate-binding protein